MHGYMGLCDASETVYWSLSGSFFFFCTFHYFGFECGLSGPDPAVGLVGKVECWEYIHAMGMSKVRQEPRCEVLADCTDCTWPPAPCTYIPTVDYRFGVDISHTFFFAFYCVLFIVWTAYVVWQFLFCLFLPLPGWRM